MTDRTIEVTIKMTADQVVALVRTLAAERGPKAVCDPMPPNAAATSALLPLCSSTTITMKMQTIMWMARTRYIIASELPFKRLPA